MEKTTHRVTDLKMQKRNRQRVNVYLDGEFAFGLARIVAAWLQIGQELSDEKIAELQAEDAREAAYQRALNLLSYRPRTSDEVRKNLKSHDITEEIIEYVMERLQRSGLLNDGQFAQTWIENRSEFRPRSRRALAYELQQRGIDRQTIEQSLQGVDDEELAYQAAQKQARKYEHLDWPDFRQKMYAFLARRGFNYQVSEPVVQRIWSERQDQDTGSPEGTNYDLPTDNEDYL